MVRKLLHVPSRCSYMAGSSASCIALLLATMAHWRVIRRDTDARRPDRTRRLASLIVVKLQVLLVEDGIFHALLDFRASSHAVGAGHVLDASGCELVLQASWDGSAFVLACRSDGLRNPNMSFLAPRNSIFNIKNSRKSN